MRHFKKHRKAKSHPRNNLMALMCEDPDGNKFWFHVEPQEIERINKRRK